MMRLGVFGAVVGFSAFAAWVPLHAYTPFEQKVFDALNQARTNPIAYSKNLQIYRTYFHGNLMHYPGEKADIETEEGVEAVDEAIAFLDHQVGLAPIEQATLLEATASDLAADQRASGNTGHEGSDGSKPGDRAKKHGGGGYVAEVIAYGPIDAEDVVRQLIIDDGVADRGHRGIIFSSELRFAGISCGPHPEFRTVCVIDMSPTPDGNLATHSRAAIR